MLTLTLVLPQGQPAPGMEFRYVLSREGGAIQSHGVAPLAMLPPAGVLVAVVPASAISWHRVALPPLAANRQRAALEGLLEEHLLDDPAQLALALAPARLPDGTALVAAFERNWVRAMLALFEHGGRPVNRLVAEFTPTGDPAAPDGWHVIGTAHAASLVLVRPHGVVCLPLSDAHAVFGTRAMVASGATVLAEPAVAELAEQWLGHGVQVQPTAQRICDAAAQGWDLAQFDLSLSGRGRMARRWRQQLALLLQAPQWRMARFGVLGLVAVHLLGFNAWAWKLDAALRERQQQIRALVTQVFPQVRTVVDAPVQMQRQLDLLRQAGGVPGHGDMETMLAQLGAALPATQHASAIEYALGELRVRGLADLDAVARDRVRATLATQGYQTLLDGERLVMRAGVAP